MFKMPWTNWLPAVAFALGLIGYAWLWIMARRFDRKYGRDEG